MKTGETRKPEIKKAILSAMALGGILFVALVAPSAVATILKPFLKNKPTKRQLYFISATVKRLQRKRLLIVQPNGYAYLTKMGEKELAKLQADDYAIPTPKKWDGNYHLIIFDIPEEKRKLRGAVRRQLVIWGFIRLQKSVWVHPYDCQEAITLLKHNFRLGNNVLHITAESIENDKWLKTEFKLAK